jgi:phosphoserine phosphatase
MMQKINVIDLDDTLLPYDSFRRLVIREVKKFDLHVVFVLILRMLKIISSEKFKKYISNYCVSKYNVSDIKTFALSVFNDLNQDVLNIVNQNTDRGTINVLISASPHFYVKEIIKILGWEGSGSYYQSSVFYNLYSNKKKEWLNNNYPKEVYEYNFAISDSSTDLSLMKDFAASILWNKHN